MEGIGFFMVLFYLAITVLQVVSAWHVFTKAGQPGWAGLIPIYNAVVLMKIIGRPLWWAVLLFIPIVNLIFGIIVSIDLAKSFGKGTGFGVGLALLWIVFMPILAFGDAQYQRPATSAAP